MNTELFWLAGNILPISHLVVNPAFTNETLALVNIPGYCPHECLSTTDRTHNILHGYDAQKN